MATADATVGVSVIRRGREKVDPSAPCQGGKMGKEEELGLGSSSGHKKMCPGDSGTQSRLGRSLSLMHH